jgi:hypothetical protein
VQHIEFLRLLAQERLFDNDRPDGKKP